MMPTYNQGFAMTCWPHTAFPAPTRVFQSSRPPLVNPFDLFNPALQNATQLTGADDPNALLDAAQARKRMRRDAARRSVIERINLDPRIDHCRCQW
jgi:hypothetical protein